MFTRLLLAYTIPYTFPRGVGLGPGYCRMKPILSTPKSGSKLRKARGTCSVCHNIRKARWPRWPSTSTRPQGQALLGLTAATTGHPAVASGFRLRFPGRGMPGGASDYSRGDATLRTRDDYVTCRLWVLNSQNNATPSPAERTAQTHSKRGQ